MPSPWCDRPEVTRRVAADESPVLWAEYFKIVAKADVSSKKWEAFRRELLGPAPT